MHKFTVNFWDKLIYCSDTIIICIFHYRKQAIALFCHMRWNLDNAMATFLTSNAWIIIQQLYIICSVGILLNWIQNWNKPHNICRKVKYLLECVSFEIEMLCYNRKWQSTLGNTTYLTSTTTKLICLKCFTWTLTELPFCSMIFRV